jgi:hypothetical protein
VLLLSCRHTARFLILWLILLPLALWGSCGWIMVPTVMIISFVLLGELPQHGARAHMHAITTVPWQSCCSLAALYSEISSRIPRSGGSNMTQSKAFGVAVLNGKCIGSGRCHPMCWSVTLCAAGIEEIGVQIEEPFSILALENLVSATLLCVSYSARESSPCTSGCWRLSFAIHTRCLWQARAWWHISGITRRHDDRHTLLLSC